MSPNYVHKWQMHFNEGFSTDTDSYHTEKQHISTDICVISSKKVLLALSSPLKKIHLGNEIHQHFANYFDSTFIFHKTYACMPHANFSI